METQAIVTDTSLLKAYEHLVRYALGKGCVVSVYDGEEWAVKLGQDYLEIIDAIESVEEAEVAIRDAATDEKGKHKLQAWALIIPSLAPDETVADNSANAWMTECDADYERTCETREEDLCKATFTDTFRGKHAPYLTDCYSLGAGEVDTRLWVISCEGEAIFNPFLSGCGRFRVDPRVYNLSDDDAEALVKANEAIAPGCCGWTE